MNKVKCIAIAISTLSILAIANAGLADGPTQSPCKGVLIAPIAPDPATNPSTMSPPLSTQAFCNFYLNYNNELGTSGNSKLSSSFGAPPLGTPPPNGGNGTPQKTNDQANGNPYQSTTLAPHQSNNEKKIPNNIHWF